MLRMVRPLKRTLKEGKHKARRKKSAISRTDPEPEISVQSVDLPSESEDKGNSSHRLLGNASEFDSLDKGVLRKHDDGLENTRVFPSVHFHALESDKSVLDVLQPSVIIAYQPNLAFVREIEIYNSESPSTKLKVYILFYEDSTEVQKFEASVRRENGAFESLIRQKFLMLIPVDQEENFRGLNACHETQSITAQNLITRKAGGKKESEKELQVIVDMREFMSSLPNVLHKKGIRIIPTSDLGSWRLHTLPIYV